MGILPKQAAKSSLVSAPIRVRHIRANTSGQEGGVKTIFNYVDPLLSLSSTPPTKEEALPVDISRITYTSDAVPGSCSFNLSDPENTVYNWKRVLSIFDNNNTSKVIPTIGDAIVIYMYDMTDETWDIIFKGYISSRSKQISSNGSYYNFSCEDIKVRLRDQVIRKTYNAAFKTATSANVLVNARSTDKPYTNERLTVKDIIKDIFDYSTKNVIDKGYDNFIRFDFSKFDFNGNKDLEDFIPPTMNFDNLPIFEAIFRVINSYGSYRLVVDYNTDKLYVCKLSYGVKNCGDEINLTYASSGNTDEWHTVNVISDSTYRRMRDVCNIMRCYSAPIEWYSGHYYIRSNYKVDNSGSTPTYTYTSDGNVIGYNTTRKKYFLGNKNFDGYDYVFGLASIPGSENVMEEQFVLVGCPLYPGWNVYSGFEAKQIKAKGYYEYWFDSYSDAFDPSKMPNSEKLVKGEVEERLGSSINNSQGILDATFVEVMGANSYDYAKSYSYEAWFPYGKCTYCDGCGAVSQDATRYANVFGKTRNPDGSKSSIGIALSLTPFDYGFIEIDSPVNKGAKELVPSNHPLPWINTCPVCKGTGIEPWFRMTTILNNLTDITPDITKMGESDENATIEQYGQAKDKTWAEIAQQRSLRNSIKVHIEDVISSPCYQKSKKSVTDIQGKFNHCLAGAKVMLNGKTIFNEEAIPENKYVQTLWYTGINEAKGFTIDADRGMIILREKKFIKCLMPQAGIKKVNERGVPVQGGEYIPVIRDSSNNKYVLYANRGQMTGTRQDMPSYWRPCRAFITCYFKRDLLEDTFSNNTEVVKRVIKGLPSDDPEQNKSYTVSAGIEDNRYFVEIASNKSISTEFNVRPIIKGATFNDFKWQIYPNDYNKWAIPAFSADGGDTNIIEIPSDYGNLWDTFYTLVKTKNYLFPLGSIHSLEQINDEEMKSLGITDVSEIARKDWYGKMYSWVHRDDRVKLIEKGMAELERRNDIQVAGNITIRGFKPNFANGFGYVTLEDGIKACIVKMELDFSNGYTVNLEVGTEELRIGQKREEEKDIDRKIDMRISDLNYINNNTFNTNNSVPGSGTEQIVGDNSTGIPNIN